MVTQAADAAVLDPATGETLQTIDVGAQPALGVEFHFGGRLVLTFTTDAVQQWDWERGDLVIEIPVSGGVATAVYSRFGSEIAVGTNDGRVVVFDSGTGEVDMEIKAHDGRVTAIDFNQSGSKVLSGGVDSKARIWDITSGELLTEAKTETVTLPIGHLVWSPGGSVAMVTSTQGETFLFSTSTGERLNSYGNGQNFNNAIAIDSSGALAVAAGVDGVGRVYGVFVGGEAAVELPTGGVPLRDAEFVPGSFDVATVGIDGKVRIWSDIFGSELPVRLTNTLYPRLTASADGDRYLIHSSVLWLNMPAGVPGTLNVIDVASGELVTQRPVVRDESGIGRPAISPDGSRVAFAGQGETSAVLSGENRGDIEILDLTDGSWFPLPDTAGWTADLEFNHDGQLLAGAAENGSIGVWDGHSGDPVRILMGHGDRVPANSSYPAEQRPGVAVSFTSQRVNDLAWHPYDDRLASVGYDGTVRVWDVSSGSGTVLHTFDYEGYSLAYTKDGTRLLASDLTGRVIELDAETGNLLREFESISSSVAIVMSPDGRYMAGAGVGGAVMWDLQTGRVTRRFQGSIFVPSGAAFVEDGKVLLVASGEGMIRGYHTDPLDLLSFAKSKTTRSLTEEECIRYVGVDGCAE